MSASTAEQASGQWYTVCDYCDDALCWAGAFYCDGYLTAGTRIREASVAEHELWQQYRDLWGVRPETDR